MRNIFFILPFMNIFYIPDFRNLSSFSLTYARVKLYSLPNIFVPLSMSIYLFFSIMPFTFLLSPLCIHSLTHTIFPRCFIFLHITSTLSPSPFPPPPPLTPPVFITENTTKRLPSEPSSFFYCSSLLYIPQDSLQNIPQMFPYLGLSSSPPLPFIPLHSPPAYLLLLLLFIPLASSVKNNSCQVLNKKKDWKDWNIEVNVFPLRMKKRGKKSSGCGEYTECC